MMRKNDSGFTLVEVLVALAILAIALGALVKGITQNAHNAASLRDRTIAHWVAANTMAEFQLYADWPVLGTMRGETTMAKRTWYWTARIATTDDPDLRRVEIMVAPDDAGSPPLGTLTSYASRS